MDQTAARFLLLDARSAYICPDVFPSREVAILRLVSMLEQKEAHVSALLHAQASKYKARVVSHWTDLAPNSSQSRTAVSVEHLKNVQAYIRLTKKHVLHLLELNVTRGITRRTLSVFVSETQTIPSVLAFVTSDESLSAPLQKCVASETRLSRLERYHAIGENNPAGDITSFDSFRHLDQHHTQDEIRPTAVRRASEFESIGETAQVVYLRQLISSLRDAVFPVGKRVAEMHRAVPRWIDKEYEGATICRRISALVENIVHDAKDEFWKLSGHHDDRGDEESSTMDDDEQGLPEDVTTALVEDEVFTSVLLEQLRSVLSDQAQPEIDAECLRCANLTQASLHVPKLYQSDDGVGDPFAYAETIAMLSTLPLYLTPSRKLDVLRSASKRLLLEMKRIAAGKGKDDLTVGGDDFIPTFMYCTIMAKMRDISFEASFLQHGMAPSCRHSELGYYATTLEFTAEFIKNMAQQRHRRDSTIHSTSLTSPRSPRPTADTSDAAMTTSTPTTCPFYIVDLDAFHARRWAAASPSSVEFVRSEVLVEGFAAVADESWGLDSLRPLRIVAAERQGCNIRSAALVRVEMTEMQKAMLMKVFSCSVTTSEAKTVRVSLAGGAAPTDFVDAVIPVITTILKNELVLEDGQEKMREEGVMHDTACMNLFRFALQATLCGPLGVLASTDPAPAPIIAPHESPMVAFARPRLDAPLAHLLDVTLQLQTYLTLCGFLSPAAPDVFVTGYGDNATRRAVNEAASMLKITGSSAEEVAAKVFAALTQLVQVCVQSIVVQLKKPATVPTLQETQAALTVWQASAGCPAHLLGRLDVTNPPKYKR